MREQGTGNREQEYQNAVDILTSQGKFHINLGLERIKKILTLLGNPQKKLKYIHVAGTNGKGSVCAMLSATLQERGKRKEERDNKFPFPVPCSLFPKCPTQRVGLFTSPHVFEYTERIKINDTEIEKEIFAQKVNMVVNLAEKHKIQLTEFEILTAIAFDFFAQNKVDIVILETGLGGRLDATNIIERNICSIITNIDLDHTERLGDTVEKIANEKAGIIKNGCPVVISINNKGFETIKKTAKEKEAQIVLAKDTTNFFEINLKGKYQQENLALVLTAIEILNKNDFEITQEMIKNGLKSVNHPCRFEYLPEKNLIIDGAHNPNGTKALRESLDECFPKESFNFIFGCLKNKDYQQMMKNLFTQKDNIYFYTFDNPTSCSYEDLSKVCEFPAKTFDKFKINTDKITVFCGSLYMIKELSEKMGIK